MKKQEVAILKEIQKNTEMAMKAIDTISDMIYDERLSMEVSKQAVKYAEIHSEVLKELVEGKAEPYRANAMDDLRLKVGIHYSTLLNTSTGHVAELMIKGHNAGIVDMEKTLNHNKAIGSKAEGMAQELLAFEEKNIGRLKSFL